MFVSIRSSFPAIPVSVHVERCRLRCEDIYLDTARRSVYGDRGLRCRNRAKIASEMAEVSEPTISSHLRFRLVSPTIGQIMRPSLRELKGVKITRRSAPVLAYRSQRIK